MKFFKTTLTLSLMFIASQASAVQVVFYCNNNSNNNYSWATEPGNAQGYLNARRICAAQGGDGSVLHL